MAKTRGVQLRPKFSVVDAAFHIQVPPHERSSACCHVVQLLFKKLVCFSGETGHTYDNKSALHKELERRELNTKLQVRACEYQRIVWPPRSTDIISTWIVMIKLSFKYLLHVSIPATDYAFIQ
jgi:hypothetical protein